MRLSIKQIYETFLKYLIYLPHRQWEKLFNILGEILFFFSSLQQPEKVIISPFRNIFWNSSQTHKVQTYYYVSSSFDRVFLPFSSFFHFFFPFFLFLPLFSFSSPFFFSIFSWIFFPGLNSSLYSSCKNILPWVSYILHVFFKHYLINNMVCFYSIYCLCLQDKSKIHFKKRNYN